MRLGRVGAVGPGADDLPGIIETEEQTCRPIGLIAEDREYRGRRSAGCIDREGTL
jgi:hypothetical protein